MRLVVGQISYLNSQPFYPLLLGAHRLIPTPPSELGRMASRGEIDAGILATADYLVNAERYEPIAGLGVANREEVRSILLASARPIEDLDGALVGVTEETSTSARLLRLVLEDRYAVRPRAYLRGARSEADAFLVIGNEALSQNVRPTPGFPYRYDLASEWWAWTGLPFVFALWAIRRSLPENVKQRFEDLLSRSFAVGMSQVDEIAAEFAGELGRAADLASYLRNFHYRLGPEEMRGFEEFRRLVLERDLLRPM
ncbi:MAG TPA: menaquinone biosynthesis protein [Vicinamibacteria bacterium]|nr:menaquinone biosynthesis protein [Vicinamibacteria bacterium]